jgi:hypothetical protein
MNGPPPASSSRPPGITAWRLWLREHVGAPLQLYSASIQALASVVGIVIGAIAVIEAQDARKLTQQLYLDQRRPWVLPTNLVLSFQTGLSLVTQNFGEGPALVAIDSAVRVDGPSPVKDFGALREASGVDHQPERLHPPGAVLSHRIAVTANDIRSAPWPGLLLLVEVRYRSILAFNPQTCTLRRAYRLQSTADSKLLEPGVELESPLECTSPP